ncbi:hypothetical protein O0L34_g16999 [Tuta absoluta]|nr:hypothetical protein O0L34_g16999 [Tuta absoluta]
MNYLESHRELALARCTRTKEGRSVSQRKWAECATLLNNISFGCTQKSAAQWRTYYNEFKSKTLKKIKAVKNSKNATDGGPAVEVQLTPLQERLYTILGEPLPGGRHRQNPVPLDNTEDHQNRHNMIEEVRIKQEKPCDTSTSKPKFPRRSELPYDIISERESTRDDSDDDDECELYCRLLAKKMRKLDERQRDIAMHEIDNMMFRAKMNSEPQKRQHSNAPLSKLGKRAPESSVFIVSEQNNRYEEEYLEDPMQET